MTAIGDRQLEVDVDPDKYCTSCGTKYPWYEEECPDCHLPLRPVPADQQPTPDTDLIAVLRTTERGLLPIARVTLEQEGIDFTVEDRGFSEQLFGRRSSATVGETAEPFSILVRAEDAERARQVLDNLQKPTHAVPDIDPEVSAAEFAAAATSGPAAVDLHDAKTGAYIGSLTQAQFEALSAHLERESSVDDDYYVDGSTLDLLSEASVDASVVRTLREALGGRDGMDVRWTRRADATLS